MRAVEREGADEIGILVVGILPDVTGQLVRGNLELWRRRGSGFLRDGYRGAGEQKKECKEAASAQGHRAILSNGIIVFDSREEEK
jgi:hypothetical protein